MGRPNKPVSYKTVSKEKEKKKKGKRAAVRFRGSDTSNHTRDISDNSYTERREVIVGSKARYDPRTDQSMFPQLWPLVVPYHCCDCPVLKESSVCQTVSILGYSSHGSIQTYCKQINNKNKPHDSSKSIPALPNAKKQT